VSFPTSGISLAGQVAIITGGGRGLGRGMAECLAAAGAKVAVIARSEDQLKQTVAAIETRGGHALAFVASVTDRQAVDHIVREVERQLGPVDILVNNAGIGHPLGPMWEVDPDQWWENLNVNLRGPFLCARAVLPGMVQRRRGRVINIVSGAGNVALAHVSAYVTAKTALIRLSENLAAETKEYNVQAFAVDPGTVRTVLAEWVLESEEGQKWMPWFASIFAEGRDVPAEQSAQLVLFLSSGRADELSGQFIGVGDDVAAWVQRAEEIRQNELHVLRRRD